MKKIQNLIVGCGFSGATLAYKIATELKEEVLIIDSKDHIGGNCYDYWNKDNICVHKYGTHIFHTNIKEVWDFLGQFTKWYPYQHKVLASIDGMNVPIPFNLNSIDQVFPKIISDKLIKKLIDKFGFNIKVPILELRKTRDKDLDFLAEYIYNNVFLQYTIKQWGVNPEGLDPLVTARVPVYVSKDNRYFQDVYQGIPLEGYTVVFENMLKNPLIDISLNTSFSDVRNNIEYQRLFFTGSIDEFFEYEFGQLPYRSIFLDFVDFNYDYFQMGAVINYPCSYDFTRIGEYKYFLNNQTDRTVVSFEYPQKFENGKNERYYPILTEGNRLLYDQYLNRSKSLKNVWFLGRLGDYHYYDMDKAILRALKLFENIKSVK